MKPRTQVILTSVNLLLLSVLVCLVLTLFCRLPANQATFEQEETEQIETINSVAFLANLCDEAGDECRPILYHPQGGQQVGFD